MRIDKFLWAVRLYKTRRQAADACGATQVLLNDNPVKSGKEVSPGHVVAVRRPPIWRTYKVLDTPKSRVGAKLLPDYIIETTTEEDLKQLEMVQLTNRQNRLEGRKGRPTKKDRRDLDGYL